MSTTQGSSCVNAWKPPLSDKIRFEEQKISSLSQEQQHAAESTHRHRTNINWSNIPIPGDDDISQEEDDSLFDDQLLPADKNRIMRLKTEIKRIKGGVTYPTGYEKDRAREIRSADALLSAKVLAHQ